jgi:ribosomal protein L19
MAEQFLGNGTVFTFTGTSGTTHTLGGVLSIEGPDAERETVDVTTLGSTVPWRSFKVGDGDPGTLTIQVAYDNKEDTQIYLNAVLATNNSTLCTFAIIYNSSQDTDTFQGYVIGRGRTIERNGMIQGPVTIKLSSAPGFATST